MRPKYATPAIVLSRAPIGEASALVTLLTPEFGLVRARAQGVRKSGAKLSAALTTLSELEGHLLFGKEGWRLSGATLVEGHFSRLSPAARVRVGRLSTLLLRLVHGESREPELFDAFRDFLIALRFPDEESQDEAECLAALRMLNALGLDAGEVPERIGEDRKGIIARINKGIAASGL